MPRYMIKTGTMKNAYTNNVALPTAMINYDSAMMLDGIPVSTLIISRIDTDAARRMASRVILPHYFVVGLPHPVMIRLIPIPGHYVIEVLGDTTHAHEQLKKEAIRLLYEDLKLKQSFATLQDNDENKAIVAVIAPKLNIPSLHNLKLRSSN